MTKKEQAEMDSLREQLRLAQEDADTRERLAKALRFTDEVKPDMAPPESSHGNEGLTKGFLFNVPTGRIAPACSGSTSHNYGSQEKTSTQGARWLYSSPVLALRGLRHEMEKECAKRLAAVDAQIEKELAALPTR